MKLRRVLTEHGPQVEALKTSAPEQWVRLSHISSLNDVQEQFSKNNLTTSILAVLELGHEGWHVLSDKVNQCNVITSDSTIVLPFQPLSFRDFLLFEKHFIDASRGFVKRFLPRQYKITACYESLTGKIFPKFKPSALWYKQPLYYFGNHLNFITTGEEILKPSYTQALDYELELGAILAKPLLNASPAEAEKAIGGYVVLNDISARDVQLAEMKSGFGPQKAKHFLNAMSHIVVTADEISDRIDQLQGSISIDGITCAACTTSTMQYSLGEAIAYVSRHEQLHVGELFGSGTLPGGSGMENDHWVHSGNLLTLEINDIAKLTNKII